MSYSLSYTEETTFTVTHARHMAAKVATDLKRMQRFYDVPSDTRIDEYEQEVVELLKGGYLGTVSYGFRRNGNWIEPMLRYTARDLAGGTANDDRPGKILPRANVAGATFYSYLTYSPSWSELSSDEQASVERRLPFSRSSANEPGLEGYLVRDRTYSSGGRALERVSLRAS